MPITRGDTRSHLNCNAGLADSLAPAMERLGHGFELL